MGKQGDYVTPGRGAGGGPTQNLSFNAPTEHRTQEQIAVKAHFQRAAMRNG
jgi:hypothetical protein